MACNSNLTIFDLSAFCSYHLCWPQSNPKSAQNSRFRQSTWYKTRCLCIASGYLFRWQIKIMAKLHLSLHLCRAPYSIETHIWTSERICSSENKIQLLIDCKVFKITYEDASEHTRLNLESTHRTYWSGFVSFISSVHHWRGIGEHTCAGW